MADLGLRVIIEAENRAQGLVDAFGRDLKAATQEINSLAVRGEQGMQRLDTSLVRTARNVRQLAVPLVTELSPAFGHTASAIAGVTTGALALTGGLAGLAVAAASIAGIVGGQLLQSWTKNREELTAFTRAVASFDMGRIAGEVQKAKLVLEPLREQLQDVTAKLEALRRRQQEVLSGPGGGLFGRPGTGGPKVASAEEERLKREIARLEGQIQTGGELQALSDVDKQLAAIEQARARNRLAQRGLFDFTRDPLAQQIIGIERQAADLRDPLIGHDPAAAARLLATIPAVRQEAFRNQRIAALSAQGVAGGEFAGAVTLGEAATLGDTIRRELEEAGVLGLDRLARETPAQRFQRRVGQLSALDALSTPSGEFVGVPTETEASAAAADTAALLLDLSIKAREVERDRTAILAQQAGVTETEKDNLELALIASEKLAKLSDARLTAEQRANVELEAQVKTGAILLRGAERTDAFAGLAKGFKDAAEEAAASGRAMQDFARTTASAMQRSFSDSFFSVVTGDFKRLGDVTRSVGQAVVRNFTDELARLVTSPALRALNQLFSGGLRPGFSAASGAPALGASAATLPGIVNVTSAGAGQLQALQQGGYDFVRQGSQTFAVPSAPGGSLLSGTTNLSSSLAGFLNYPLLGATAAPLEAAYAGGLSAGLDAYTASIAATNPAGSASAAGAAGITVGGALSSAAAVAGFALSLYGAYQSGDPLYGAASGAPAGAAAGAAIAVGLGLATFGVGAVVGLVAGAALGAGAGAAGKGGGNRKARQAAERQRTQQAGQQFVAEVRAARSPTELYDTLARWTSGTYGGSTPIAIISTVTINGLTKIVGRSGGGNALATVIDLIIAPQGYRANIQAGIDLGTRESINDSLTQEVQQKILELQVAFDDLEIFSELRGIGGRAELARQSLFPFSDFGNLDRFRGEQLGLFTGAAWEVLPAETKEQILRDLAQVDADRDLKIIRREDGGDVIVSVVESARQLGLLSHFEVFEASVNTGPGAPHPLRGRPAWSGFFAGDGGDGSTGSDASVGSAATGDAAAGP